MLSTLASRNEYDIALAGIGVLVLKKEEVLNPIIS
jgi:hypothetical protein